MSSKHQDLKQECFEANMQLNELKLVVYTFGNVSAVDREKWRFAIKPSGVAYEELKLEDIVIVDFDNNITEGAMHPFGHKNTCLFIQKLAKYWWCGAYTRNLFGGMGSGKERHPHIRNPACRPFD